MLVVPVTAHEYYARLLAPYLKPQHVVLLNPGHTGGGLHFVNTLRQAGNLDDIRTGETSTLTYGSRITGPAEVTFYLRAREMPFAAFPGRHAADLFRLVTEVVYPRLQLAPSVLHTGLLNINAIEHPPQILCNAGWLEHTEGDYYFYYEGTTPAVGRVIDAVDAERLSVASALGIETPTFPEMFLQVGYTTEHAVQVGTAYQALQESAPNRWVKGPKSLDHRYVHEDVGYGLVPLSGLGDLAGVPTPTMKSLISLASTMNGVDYASTGRTLDKLGLAGVPVDKLQSFLAEGRL
jgi:opine dehydrogenase